MKRFYVLLNYYKLTYNWENLFSIIFNGLTLPIQCRHPMCLHGSGLDIYSDSALDTWFIPISSVYNVLIACDIFSTTQRYHIHLWLTGPDHLNLFSISIVLAIYLSELMLNQHLCFSRGLKISLYKRRTGQLHWLPQLIFINQNLVWLKISHCHSTFVNESIFCQN